jgi:hypothetical protein
VQAPAPRTDRERIDVAIGHLKRAVAEINYASQALDGAPEEQQLRPEWFESNRVWHAADAALKALEDKRDGRGDAPKCGKCGQFLTGIRAEMRLTRCGRCA